MAITASMVKELRERTGAGMMECKKALEEAGNLEEAVLVLRKAGQAKADKRATKQAAEGVIVIALKAHNAVMLEINSQTDFVARSDDLKGFAQQVIEAALSAKAPSVEVLTEIKLASGASVEHTRRELVNKIGENIQLRRLTHLDAQGLIGTYLHGDRIGVLVEMEGGDLNLAKDIAMHIAASNPKALSAEDISPELIEIERQVFLSQAAESGKAPEIAAKMIEGRINKFLKENSLLGQPFIKNPDQTITDLLKQHNAKIKSFVRYEVGEGMEKQSTDFAEEVMQQVKGTL